jgi:hypothetical protein
VVLHVNQALIAGRRNFVLKSLLSMTMGAMLTSETDCNTVNVSEKVWSVYFKLRCPVSERLLCSPNDKIDL